MFNYITKDRDGDMMPNLPKIIIHTILAIVLLAFFLGSFTIVGAGERGVVLTWGAFNNQIFDPGLHFKIPFVQRVVKMSVRTTAVEREKSEAYSHDLQVVDIHSLVNYNIDPQAVGTVYQNYGLDFESNLIVARVEAGVKQTIAQYTAEELLSKRGEVQGKIQDVLTLTVPPQFIVTKYSLVNEAFSPEFERAIEDKQVALQKAEQAKNELAKAEIDAKARIATATGEAEAIRIQAQAITQQGGKEYVNLKWVEKWDGKLPQTMLGDSTPLVNIGK